MANWKALTLLLIGLGVMGMLLLVGACKKTQAPEPTVLPPPTSTFIPLEVGNTWEYCLRDSTFSMIDGSLMDVAQERITATIISRRDTPDSTVTTQWEVIHNDGRVDSLTVSLTGDTLWMESSFTFPYFLLLPLEKDRTWDWQMAQYRVEGQESVLVPVGCFPDSWKITIIETSVIEESHLYTFWIHNRVGLMRLKINSATFRAFRIRHAVMELTAYHLQENLP